MAEVSPDLFLDAILGYQKTAALKAALALDLFTAISQNGGDFHRIAEHTGASARGIRILCDAAPGRSNLVPAGAAPQPRSPGRSWLPAGRRNEMARRPPVCFPVGLHCGGVDLDAFTRLRRTRGFDPGSRRNRFRRSVAQWLEHRSPKPGVGV